MRRPGLILLAAGGSSRMGQSKQLLPWGEGTLLRHACETALVTSCRPVVVVLGCEAERCRRDCADLPLLLIDNPDWAEGLGTSLAAGVAALIAADSEVTGALVMLADQPNVTAALVEMLLAHWAPPAWPIAAVAYGNEGGVPAIFDRCYFPDLLCHQQDRGARALILREMPHVALLRAAESLVDVDTPAIYHALRPRAPEANGILLGDFTD